MTPGLPGGWPALRAPLDMLDRRAGGRESREGAVEAAGFGSKQGAKSCRFGCQAESPPAGAWSCPAWPAGARLGRCTRQGPGEPTLSSPGHRVAWGRCQGRQVPWVARWEGPWVAAAPASPGDTGGCAARAGAGPGSAKALGPNAPLRGPRGPRAAGGSGNQPPGEGRPGRAPPQAQPRPVRGRPHPAVRLLLGRAWPR